MPFKIIYIDDEIDLCELFRDNFDRNSLEVAVYADSRAGVQAAIDHPPDLIIIDYRLPDTTGDLIAKEMDPMIPKILVTGDLSVEPMSEFIQVLHKPFSFAEMEGLIDDLIRHRQKAAS